jgi:hypothetical protein
MVASSARAPGAQHIGNSFRFGIKSSSTEDGHDSKSADSATISRSPLRFSTSHEDRYEGRQTTVAVNRREMASGHTGVNSVGLPDNHGGTNPEPMRMNPATNQLMSFAGAAHAAPVARDVLDSALALEESNEALPDVSPEGIIKGYHVQTPTGAERQQGATNCSTFVSDALHEAGYDVSRTIEYELPNGDVIHPSVDDWVNNRAEEESQKHREVGEDFVPVLPEVLNPRPGRTAKSELIALVKSSDPRIQGAPYALSATGQAEMIGTRETGGWDNLRPGDVLQTWKSNGVGHSTIVHSISGIDPRTNQSVTIGPDTDPSDFEGVQLTQVRAELLGSHLPKGRNLNDLTRDADGVLEGDSIYVKDGGNSSSHYRWYAARPNGSDWSP